MRPFVITALAAAQLALMPGCSQASVPASADDGASPTKSVATRAAAARSAAPPTPETRTASRVLGKRDFALRGKPACEVRFVYAGRDAEDLFWEAPCEAVTAKMMGRQELRTLGKWDRLDSYARKFVGALPGGKVLYVEGGFSASVYPVGTTGSTYEVPVAD